MPVSIIGTRGCGKSTLIGLLYQGMERYANENPKEFVYFTTSEVGDKILEIRNNMLKGEYPAASLRKQLVQLKFLLGFRPRIHERIRQTFTNFASFGKYGKHLGLILSVYDISGEDIEEYKRSKSMNEVIKKVFDANVVVVIVDSAKFTNSKEGRKLNVMLEYDKELATILSAYVEYRSKNKLEEELYPIFILAKLDSIDSEIKNQFSIDRLTNKYDKDVAQEVGDKLMKRYLSASRAAIYGAERVGIKLQKSKYFFSWVEEERIDGVADAQTPHKLKVLDKTTEFPRNVYPEHMYVAFLNHIRNLSYKYSDPKQLVEEIFSTVSSSV